MNGIFLFCALLVMLLLLFLDLKRIPKMPKSMKLMYMLFLIATFALYVAVVLGAKPPMPTQWFIENVSPRVFALIHSQK